MITDHSKSNTVYDKASGNPLLYNAYNVETGKTEAQAPNLEDIGDITPLFIQRPDELDDQARVSRAGFPGDSSYFLDQQVLSSRFEEPLVERLELEIGKDALARLIKNTK